MDIASETKINWYLNALPQKTRKAFLYLAKQKWLAKTEWYLAGGTALALQVNHRQSLDLDFFISQKTFEVRKITNHFDRSIWRPGIVREGTIYGEIMGAKVSFIAYPFFVSKQKPNWYGSIRILTPKDIAVMKLIAVSQRGRKRDFLDIYWYIKNREPLEELLKCLPKQYPTVAHDYHHILKSLIYFEYANADPMPKIMFRAAWSQVKQYFRSEVQRVSQKILE